MKYLLILLIILFLTSCEGTQTVKTLDGLTIKTIHITSTIYPNYNTGDTVIIYRHIHHSDWYICTIDVDIRKLDDYFYKKGVIQ